MSVSVTQILILCAIVCTALVQSQRVSPTSLALSPSRPWEQDPWRLLTCLFYSDGFSIGLAIRLHLLARFSSTLEHVAFGRSKLHHIGAIAVGVAAMVVGMQARPAELAQPYLLTALCFFVAYVAMRLPVGVKTDGCQSETDEPEKLSNLLWPALCLLAGSCGASAALAQMLGVGAGLVFELLELLEPPPKPTATDNDAPGASAADAPRKPGNAAVDGGNAATKEGSKLGGVAVDGGEAPRSAPGRRNGSLRLLLLCAAISHYLGLEKPPPSAAHQRMSLMQSETVDAALRLDLSQPAVEEVVLRLGTRAGVANATFTSPLQRAAPIKPGQVLNLFGECADHWRRKLAQAGRLSAISAPSTMRAISRRDAMSAAAAGPAAAAAASGASRDGLAMNELLLAELDRDLADALSRIEFSEDRDDKTVLKELLPELPQAEIIAALPKERQASYREQMLATIATHRESHTVAHAALARLGDVFQELTKSPGSLEVLSEEEVVALAAAASAAKAAEAEAKEAKEKAAKEEATEEETADVEQVPKAVEAAEAVEAADVVPSEPVEEVALSKQLVDRLYETLGAFSIPTEMSHQEVLNELLQGSNVPLDQFPTNLTQVLLDQIALVRSRIMDDFISAGVKELRGLLVPNASNPAPTPAPVVAGAPPPPAWATVPNVTHAFDLAVELLMQHDVDEAESDGSVVDHLLITLELNGTDAQLVPGTHALLLETVTEWRRNKAAEAALKSLRALLTADQLDYVSSADGQRRAPASATAPISQLQDLVSVVLSGYEIAPTMKDDDVLLELLRLGAIQQDTLAPDAIIWLGAAIVAHRGRAATPAAEPVAAEVNATEPAADARRQVRMLLPSLQTLSATALVSGKDVPPSAYAEDAEDAFALFVASVLQAAGATTRLALMCADAASAADAADDERLADADADADAVAGARGHGQGRLAAASSTGSDDLAGSRRRCRLVAEVRMGKIAENLAKWVSVYRKSQKAVKKAVKGAKEVHFRRQGSFLWLSLRWQSGAAEQYPGAPYLQNFTHCVNFPSAGTWEVEGEALDSNGLPKIARSPVDSVRSTM